jgi:hypothetical protein
MGTMPEKELIEFENALKQRNFEIDLFWKRSWFFGALIIAEIATFYQLKSEPIPSIPSVAIVFVTCLTILAQCLMNRGSKYWQERWEYMTMNREAALKIELTRLKKIECPQVDEWLASKYENIGRNEWLFIDTSILSKGESIFTKSHRFSVSKIIFLVWDIIFICSVLCWLNESISMISANPNWEFTIKLTLLYSVIIGYIIWVSIKGNIYEPYKKEILSLNAETKENLSDMYVRNEFNDTIDFEKK